MTTTTRLANPRYGDDAIVATTIPGATIRLLLGDDGSCGVFATMPLPPIRHHEGATRIVTNRLDAATLETCDDVAPSALVVGY